MSKEKRLDEYGREILNPIPMAPPVGYNRTPSLSEQIRSMVRSECLALEAEAAGLETFEEADDFDVGDDFDPSSPYEEVFDPTPIPELRRRQQAAQQAAKPPQEPPTNNSAGDQPAPGIRSASEDHKPS